ncbi:MAG: hypothetical protein AAGF66_18465 [Cyanobacteria bacterium P01_H01_bin.119]
MPSYKHLQQAKSGNPQAIAVLLNRALADRRITAQVQQCGDELQILLNSEHLPDQPGTVKLIRQGLLHLRPEAIAAVTLMAQTTGLRQDQWQITFDLYGAPPALPTQPKPGPQAVNQLAAEEADANLSDALVNEAARSRDAVQPRFSEPVPPHNPDPNPVDLSSNQAPTAKARQPENLLQIVLIGMVLGALVTVIKPIAFVLHPLIVIIHELGHAFAAWLVGYPAIPSFDFVHGGGITAHFSRWPLIIYLTYAGLAALYYRYRKNYLTLRLLLGITLVYSGLVFLPVHEDFITVMGHGFELLFVVIFGFQGLTGLGCRNGQLEQPLYVMVAFYIWLSCAGFGWKLINDAGFRAQYLSGKGGLVNDFVILAGQYTGGNLTAIAIAFLSACAAILPILWLLQRHRHRLAAAIHRFWLMTDAQRFSW